MVAIGIKTAILLFFTKLNTFDAVIWNIFINFNFIFFKNYSPERSVTENCKNAELTQALVSNNILISYAKTYEVLLYCMKQVPVKKRPMYNIYITLFACFYQQKTRSRRTFKNCCWNWTLQIRKLILFYVYPFHFIYQLKIQVLTTKRRSYTTSFIIIFRKLNLLWDRKSLVSLISKQLSILNK